MYHFSSPITSNFLFFENGLLSLIETLSPCQPVVLTFGHSASLTTSITLSIKVYYNLGQVERNEKGAYAKYDRRTAQRNMGKYGHYGPWNEIDDSLHEGAIPDTKREIGKQKIRLSKDMKDILLDKEE